MKENSPISSNALKWIAIITMTIDHFGIVFLMGNEKYITEYNICILVSRISFPIFAFLITEGFMHTKSVAKYMIRLAVLAVISEIPFDLIKGQLFNFNSQNIFWSLLIGLIVLYFIDKKYIIKETDFSVIVRFLIIAAGAGLATLIRADYAWLGILVIVSFYYIRSNYILYSIAIIVFYMIRSDISIALAVIPVLILIYFYNGKRGKNNAFLKWFFYLYYPAHLTILIILKYVCHVHF